MGEARRKAEAAARGQGGTAADRAFLRKVERIQQEVRQELRDGGDDRLRPTMLEAVEIEEALEHPVFGCVFRDALRVATAVASGGPSTHPAAGCMTFDEAWALGRMPVAAVIGFYAGNEIGGLVCAACAGREH